MADTRTLATMMFDSVEAGLPDGARIPADRRLSAIEHLAGQIKELLGSPVLPSAGETCAVSIKKPKTAALFFDRVWSSGLDAEFPSEVRFYGASDREVFVLASPGFLDLPVGKIEGYNRDIAMRTLFGQVSDFGIRPDAPTLDKYYARAVSFEHGLTASTVFESEDDFQGNFTAGDTEAIVTVIEGMDVINEERLEWKQVVEFRKDALAKERVRRLRSWMREYDGQPVEFVVADVSKRLEDYEWALKKHGIETAVGTASDLIDPGFLSAASLAVASMAVAGSGTLAALGGGGLALGRVVLSVGKRLLDRQDIRRGGRDFAFISEAKKALS